MWHSNPLFLSWYRVKVKTTRIEKNERNLEERMNLKKEWKNKKSSMIRVFEFFEDIISTFVHVFLICLWLWMLVAIGCEIMNFIVVFKPPTPAYIITNILKFNITFWELFIHLLVYYMRLISSEINIRNLNCFYYCLISKSGPSLGLFRLNVSNPLKICDLLFIPMQLKILCKFFNYLELKL